jgi:hypothetical protein
MFKPFCRSYFPKENELMYIMNLLLKLALLLCLLKYNFIELCQSA